MVFDLPTIAEFTSGVASTSKDLFVAFVPYAYWDIGFTAAAFGILFIISIVTGVLWKILHRIDYLMSDKGANDALDHYDKLKR